MQFYPSAFHYPLKSRYSQYTVLSNPLPLLSFMSKYFSNTLTLVPDFMPIQMGAYSDSSVYSNHQVFRCEPGREMILNWMVESIFGILYLQNRREKNANTLQSWNQSQIPMPFFDDSKFFFFFFPFFLCFWPDFFSGDDSFQSANVSINPLEVYWIIKQDCNTYRVYSAVWEIQLSFVLLQIWNHCLCFHCVILNCWRFLD